MTEERRVRSVVLGVLALGATLVIAGLATPHASVRGDRDVARLNSDGVAAYGEGAYSQALGYFERALELDPDSENVRANLALTHLALALSLCEENGEVRYREDAVQEMQTAISYQPANAEIHGVLGRLYLVGGRLDEARQELEEALRLDPSDGGSACFLGEVAYQAGDLAGALDRWEQALRLDPSDTRAAERLRQVQREEKVERGFARRERSHFVLRYDVDPAGIPSQVEEMLVILEDAYREVARELQILPDQPVPVVIYEEPDFRTVTGLHDWASGVFDGKIRVPYERLREGSGTMRQVLLHEYTHAAVHTVAGHRCPVWLTEGLAQVLAKEWRPENAEILEAAEQARQLIPLEVLSGSFIGEPDEERVRLYYLESYAAVRYLMSRYGGWYVGRALRELGAGKGMEAVLAEVFTLRYEQLDAEMARRIRWGDFRR